MTHNVGGKTRLLSDSDSRRTVEYGEKGGVRKNHRTINMEIC